MDKIPNRREFLTLHVGLGTFKGISTADIRDYDIHRESVEISTSIFDKIAKIKTENKKIVAVGTTTTRTLESLPYLWRVLDQDLKNTIDANTRNYWDTFTERLEKHDWIHNIVEYNRNSHFSEIYQKQEARGSSAQRDSKGAYEPVSN